MRINIAIIISLALLTTVPVRPVVANSGTRQNTHPHSLIAHWTFDELAEGTFANAAGKELAARPETAFSIRDGVFGAALWLEGRSVVRVKAGDQFGTLSGLTISAWVKPDELSGCREIFRKEDGDRRILFSFQQDGRILSLGLQTEGTGYEELDAPVDPAMLVDHHWHHVAGTYDGSKMAVFVDGLMVASVDRTGRILSGGPADAFIGSLGGRGEYFQGGIDDLRIFESALGADQIARIHEKGLCTALSARGTDRTLTEELYAERETPSRQPWRRRGGI